MNHEEEDVNHTFVTLAIFVTAVSVKNTGTASDVEV